MVTRLLAKAANPTGSADYAAAAGYFVVQWLLMLGGAVVHIALDRRKHPERRHSGRTTELLLVWVLAFSGAWGIVGGIGHISGLSDQLAESIGYTQSMFQWEIGWADIAIGVLGVLCIWRRDASWFTAAIVVFAISYGGDAIGHLIQWTKHSNTEPDNVWAIPSDILGPALAAGLFWHLRRTTRATAAGSSASALP